MAKSQWKTKSRLPSLPENQTVPFGAASSWLEDGLVLLHHHQRERANLPEHQAKRTEALDWLNSGCSQQKNNNTIVRTHIVSLPDATSTLFSNNPIVYTRTVSLSDTKSVLSYNGSIRPR